MGAVFRGADRAPVFSKDIDLRGTRLVAQALAQGMKLRGAKVKDLVAAKRKQPAGLGMNFVVPLDLADGRSTVIEVLEALPWVDDGPDRPYGFGIEVEGIPLLDPLSLFIRKLHAWHPRDDPDKTSNDRLHLELLGEIIRNSWPKRSAAEWTHGNGGRRCLRFSTPIPLRLGKRA